MYGNYGIDVSFRVIMARTLVPYRSYMYSQHWATTINASSRTHSRRNHVTQYVTVVAWYILHDIHISFQTRRIHIVKIANVDRTDVFACAKWIFKDFHKWNVIYWAHYSVIPMALQRIDQIHLLIFRRSLSLFRRWLIHLFIYLSIQYLVRSNISEIAHKRTHVNSINDMRAQYIDHRNVWCKIVKFDWSCGQVIIVLSKQVF